MKGIAIDRRRWAFRGLLALSGAALLGAAFSGLFGDLAFERASIEADAFSRSAIGHRGFVEWLRREGFTPIIVRSLANRRSGSDVPAVVLEPKPRDAAVRLAIAPLADRTAPALIVAPKREGKFDPLSPSWISGVRPIDAPEIESVLGGCGLVASVRATPGESTFHHPSLASPLRVADAQTLESADLEPIVGGPGHILFGRHRERREVYFLSEPDLVANHGIDDPSRREFLRVVLREMGWTPRPILIDETIHGATFERDVWREALRMPLLPLTVSVILTAIVTIASACRFLSPRRDLSAFCAGKLALIRNTAGLHGESMDAAELCRRYRAMVESDLAAHLGVPERGRPEDRRSRIALRAAALGKPFDLEAWQRGAQDEVHGRTGAQAALSAIARLRKWRDEVMRGSSGD